MKKLEYLFNRLDFGIYMPVRYSGRLISRFIDTCFEIFVYKYFSPEKRELARIEEEKAQGFLKDWCLFLDYNLIDCIVCFSIAIQFLVITAESPFSRRFDDLLYSLHINADVFAILLIAAGLLGYLPVYYFFHRNDKREIYFEEFIKEPDKEKWKWSGIVLIVYIASWAIAFALRYALSAIITFF